jgi:predicted component of type VI protein secretion system
MAKLVVLSAGLAGVSYELKTDKTTVGRVEDNTFQITQASVSSHHCEVLLRGSDVVVKDLNSTNGTFINNQQITGEGVIKPGQTLRLGEVEMRLDAGSGPSSTTGSPGTTPPAAPPAKRPMDSTMVINKGVSLQQLQQGPEGFDTTKGVFTKKRNKTNITFIIIGVVLLLVIIGAVIAAVHALNQPGK